MSETRINTSFYYDPIRQGYDTNLWHTIAGAPANVAGRLRAPNSIIIHYADVVKGDFTFNLNVPDSPGGNDGRIIGLYQPNRQAYIVFTIGDTLTGDASNGTNTATTGTMPWDSNWNGVNTDFAIRWEAGTAKFFINGTQVGCITDVAVPAGPLSLYVADISLNPMSIGDISAQSVQSYVLNAKSADSTVYDGMQMIVSQGVTVTDVPNISMSNFLARPVETVAVSENVAVVVLVKPSVSDNVTITENIAETVQ